MTVNAIGNGLVILMRSLLIAVRPISRRDVLKCLEVPSEAMISAHVEHLVANGGFGRKVLRASAEILLARMSLGRILREQGRLEEAAAEFRTVIKMPLPTSFLRFGQCLNDPVPSDIDNRTKARQPCAMLGLVEIALWRHGVTT